MNNEDKHFIKRYEELLDKGYCDCNEMNCIDNNSPRRILNIVKDLQKQLEAYKNVIKEVLDKLNNWDEEKSLAIDDYYLKDDLLNILNKIGSDK